MGVVSRWSLLGAALFGACSGGGPTAPANGDAPTGPPVDATTHEDDGPVDAPASFADGAGPDGAIVDLDRDGLDDAEEDRIAHAYLPFLSVHPQDGCPLAAIVYRLHPHPDAPGRLHLIVDVLFQRDCGLGGHPGDDEVFAMTIDPAQPPPDGILAIRAIAHQNTPCQHVSQCGRCAGLEPCTTAPRAGASFPVVYYSQGKHGSYTTLGECNGACFLSNFCVLAPESAAPPMRNAGEPDAPLTTDLTAAGLITASAGWTDTSLYHYDPWGGSNFGGAGSVASDLVDPAFDTPGCLP